MPRSILAAFCLTRILSINERSIFKVIDSGKRLKAGNRARIQVNDRLMMSGKLVGDLIRCRTSTGFLAIDRNLSFMLRPLRRFRNGLFSSRPGSTLISLINCPRYLRKYFMMLTSSFK